MARKETGKQQVQRGQSLTEVALLLPILLLIIAGLVEVSNLIVVQSRIDTAARIGARFGSSGGEPQGIRLATLNAITQTLELDESVWDMWVFEGSVNISGTAFTTDSWTWSHVYGLGQTANFTGTNNVSVQQEVLANLRSQGDQNAAEINVIGLLIYHEVDSILGLEYFIRGFNSVRGFAVMELAPGPHAVQTNGCSAFPILVEYGQRSVNPSNYNAVTDWEYPAAAVRPNLSSFPGHLNDLPLDEAPEGSIFHFSAPSNYPHGAPTSQFDWLAWNTVDPDTTSDLEELENSLTWPGNSVSSDPVVAYVDPISFIRDGMHSLDPFAPTAYDLVSKTPVNVDSDNVGSIMREHIDRGRSLRMVVWQRDLSGGGTGPSDTYKIRGFIVGRIIGYQLDDISSTHWLMVELIGWEDSCGLRVPGVGG